MSRIEELKKKFEVEYTKDTPIDEITNRYQVVVDGYTKYVKDCDSKGLIIEDQITYLKEDEAALAVLANEWDLQLKNKTYKLAGETTWKDKKLSQAVVATKIRAMLDKVEVEYRYTLGMYQLYEWWKSPKKKIEYAVLNSTLRTLGQAGLKFKGSKEWEDILIIDQYFRESNREYSIDTLHTLAIASCHSAVMDALQLNKPMSTETPEQEGGIEIVEERG